LRCRIRIPMLRAVLSWMLSSSCLPPFVSLSLFYCQAGEPGLDFLVIFASPCPLLFLYYGVHGVWPCNSLFAFPGQRGKDVISMECMNSFRTLPTNGSPLSVMPKMILSIMMIPEVLLSPI
jgi:hypothetical protein